MFLILIKGSYLRFFRFSIIEAEDFFFRNRSFAISWIIPESELYKTQIIISS